MAAELRDSLRTLNLACSGIKFTKIELSYDDSDEEYKCTLHFKHGFFSKGSLSYSERYTELISKYDTPQNIETYLMNKAYEKVYRHVMGKES